MPALAAVVSWVEPSDAELRNLPMGRDHGPADEIDHARVRPVALRAARTA